MDPIKNLAEATLASGIAADATTAPLVAGEGAELSTGAAFDVAIWNFTDYGDNHNAAKRAGKLELARVTRSTDTLTFVTRGLAPTSAIAHNTSGKVYKVRQVPTKELFDQLATKDNGVHTGTTSVQVLSPDIADLGTAASGTVTLSSTKAVNKVILSGSAATIALPSSPPDGWRSLVASITGNVALTVTTPSLYRLDDPALGTVTSVSIAAATAGKAIFSFLAIGGSYVGFAVIGDDSSIPSSKLAGLSTDGTNASPSNSTFLSSQAYATHLAATLDALTLPYTDVVGFPTGTIAGRGTAATGALESITVGAGLNLTGTTLTATNTGSSTPVEITGTDIDWTDSGVFTDTISAHTTYTFSNTTDGQTIRALITATGAYNVTWPANVYGAPSQTSTATDLYQITRFGVFFICTRLSANLTIDTAPAVVTSATINTAGDALTVTFDKDVTVTDGSGFTLNLTGGGITVSSSPTGTGTSSLVFALTGRTVADGETGTLDYNGDGGIIGEANGVAVEDFTGEVVTNSSTYSTYLFSQDTSGGSGSAQSGASSLNGTTTWNKSTSGIFTGAGTYCWELDGAVQVDVGSAQNSFAFFFHFTAKENNATWIYLRNGSGTDQATIEFRSDRINYYHGGVLSAKITTTTADAQGVIWGTYTANTGGNNGTCSIYYNDNSNSESRPVELGSTTTNGAGGAVQRIVFATPVAGQYRVGKLRIATSLIGSSPL